MKTKRIGVTAVFLLAAAFLLSGSVQQESAKQLFEKALHLEETKGDLEKAVEVYKRIVAEFPGERVLAAQSFYHLGLCYEKLGLRAAQKADQKGNTLNRWLRDIVSGKEVRVLSTPGDLHDCWWSPDSQWIAYMNGTNSVVILPAEGGQPKTIIESAPEVHMGGDYVWPMGWASDSKKLIAQDSAKGLFAIPVSGANREET